MWKGNEGARAAAAAVVCLAALAFNDTELFAQSLPAPWAARDIGAPALHGGATYNQGTFTIAAAGTDIWGSSDQFRFVYQQVTGDVDVIARVDSIVQTDDWAKAGVMIRASLAANAAHGSMFVSAAKGTAFQRRTATGGLSTSTAGPLAAPPRWVRIIRRGTSVDAYTSSDGTTWTRSGSDTIALGTTAYVGLAVTSHSAGAVTTASISRVSVAPLSLPSPQRSVDIGAPALASSVAYSQGVYDVRAAGVDIWGTSDQFNYVYQPVSGDFEVLLRVDSIANVNVSSKTGVMVRETLAANSPHAYALVTPGHGFAFQRRIEAGGYTFSTAGTASAFPGWVKLVRIGALFQAFQSTDGTRWVSMGSEAIPMADAVYVGIATTSHDATVRTQAIVEQFSVATRGGAANQPPTVAITSPADGSTLQAATNVTVAATASDSDGTIVRVDFYVGTTLIGSDTTAPYTASWPSVLAGTYAVTAVAFDNGGASAASPVNRITVSAPTSSAPTGVAFQKSPDHDTLVTSYELRIFASGANPSTATPLARSNLAKPTPDANGDITVDRSTFFGSLAPGSYIATVAALGSGGSNQSSGVPFTR